ncbi:MAG TPA: flagellar biosynthesis protein [Burkholderiaceae bacterium]|nr:flagellar biosynthesis protein [Burkholderiaceae bacterium]
MSLHTATGTRAGHDQAAGLRRLFGSTRQHFIALAHNEHVPQASLVIDRLCGAASALGLHTLVVDAADSAPAPHEMALIDLPSCIEPLSDDVSYLAARGLPIRHVDALGRCGAFLDALARAAPHADLLLMHAGTVDLARLFAGRRVRPILMGADTPRAMTEAYASLKRLAQRPGWLAHDVLIVADPQGPRTDRLGESLAECAERFLGAAIHDCVVIDPQADALAAADPRLIQLLRAQLSQELMQDGVATPAAHVAPAVH